MNPHEFFCRHCATSVFISRRSRVDTETRTRVVELRIGTQVGIVRCLVRDDVAPRVAVRPGVHPHRSGVVSFVTVLCGILRNRDTPIRVRSGACPVTNFNLLSARDSACRVVQRPGPYQCGEQDHPNAHYTANCISKELFSQGEEFISHSV